MTLAEAVAHIGGPVLIRQPSAVETGQIIDVDQRRQLVRVQLRRRRHPYDLLTRNGWYAPCHLAIPNWWTRRQTTKETL
ncbi:hypothetical protein [Micromonospora wenchangensis]|uniref:hypothetical protein n=1 Tax=Micromonospora wenchangensis TaxID=1185415 RepID=UPI00381740CC